MNGSRRIGAASSLLQTCDANLAIYRLNKSKNHGMKKTSTRRSKQMPENFADFIARERERLHAEREQVFNQQHELENKLADINRELAAIDAYEAAKSGKAAAPVRQTRGRAGRQARRGSRREGLLALIRKNPGLGRGEILERMGLKGNKAGEMSVSNALTALTKAGQVSRSGGKYRVSA